MVFRNDLGKTAATSFWLIFSRWQVTYGQTIILAPTDSLMHDFNSEIPLGQKLSHFPLIFHYKEMKSIKKTHHECNGAVIKLKDICKEHTYQCFFHLVKFLNSIFTGKFVYKEDNEL